MCAPTQGSQNNDTSANPAGDADVFDITMDEAMTIATYVFLFTDPFPNDQVTLEAMSAVGTGTSSGEVWKTSLRFHILSMTTAEDMSLLKRIYSMSADDLSENRIDSYDAFVAFANEHPVEEIPAKVSLKAEVLYLLVQRMKSLPFMSPLGIKVASFIFDLEKETSMAELALGMALWVSLSAESVVSSLIDNIPLGE